jgi:putative tricarboxylic transport membrane protein
MRAFARSGDLWSGLVLAALGTYIVLQARGWMYMGEDGPGPGFFPTWYGGAMLVLSLLLAVGAAMKARDAPAGADIRWRGVGRAFACWAAFVACIAVMPVLGFPISFALLTWFVVAVMARQPQRIAVGLAIGGAILFYVLFELALDLPLPRGMLY